MIWVLIFWHKMWNCCPERYGKFQSEIPSTSGAICEKPQGGGPLGLPAGRGILYLNGVEQPFKRHQCPFFLPLRWGTRAFGAGPSVPGVGARPSAPPWIRAWCYEKGPWRRDQITFSAIFFLQSIYSQCSILWDTVQFYVTNSYEYQIGHWSLCPSKRRRLVFAVRTKVMCLSASHAYLVHDTWLNVSYS